MSAFLGGTEKGVDLLLSERLNLIWSMDRGFHRNHRRIDDVALGDEPQEEGTKDSVGVLHGPGPNRLGQAWDSVATTRIGVTSRDVAKESFDFGGLAGLVSLSAKPPNEALGDRSPGVKCLLGELAILSV